MYYDTDATIAHNQWCALYADDLHNQVAAYIKRRDANDIPPLAPGISNALAGPHDSEPPLVYFPILGETENDARECYICRAKIVE